jgi:hypothetical protein
MPGEQLVVDAVLRQDYAIGQRTPNCGFDAEAYLGVG